MILTSRRTFIAGLLAAVAVPAVAMPSGLVEATQGMVEDAIADSAFDLGSLCWTAKLDIFRHRFDVVGRTQQRALELALAGIKSGGDGYRVMPTEVAEKLTAKYAHLLNGYPLAPDDEISVQSLTPEQLGLYLPISLVQQDAVLGKRFRMPNLSAAMKLHRRLNGGKP
jgi:hypothetical protein